VDSTWCHAAWSSFLGLPPEILLLSDFNRDFGRAYGLLVSRPDGPRDILRRVVLVIDRDGAIRYRWDQPDPPRLPQVDEVLAEVRKLATSPS